MLCADCGASLSSNVKGRVSLGPDSTGAAEPCERVFSMWISLVRKLFQGISIEQTNINAANPGKMSKICLVNVIISAIGRKSYVSSGKNVIHTFMCCKHMYQTTNTALTLSRSASIVSSHSRSTNIALPHSRFKECMIALQVHKCCTVPFWIHKYCMVPFQIHKICTISLPQVLHYLTRTSTAQPH